MYSDFIIDVLELGAKRWNVTIETSLNVPFKQVEKLAPFINEIFVDIKDTNSSIYESYTQSSNVAVIENLQSLAAIGFTRNVTVRIPQIKGYNTDEDVQKSKQLLEAFGYTSFDIFEYKTNFRYERQGKM
jgi:pyruvate formate lyase activating enzyme